MKFSLLFCIICFTLISCSIHKTSIQFPTKTQPKVYLYKYLGFDYPDSLAKEVGPMKNLLDLFPKNPDLHYIIGSDIVAIVRYDSSGHMLQREVHSLTSDEIVQFSYDSKGQYYKNIRIQDSNTLDDIWTKINVVRSVPEESKVIQGIDCGKFNLFVNGQKTESSIYFNEQVPINYRQLNNGPKGLPFHSTEEFMAGITLNYGVVDSVIYIEDVISLLNMDTTDYIDAEATAMKLLDISGLQEPVPSFTHRQSVYLSLRNDTIVASTPNCISISDFQLNIDKDNLQLFYTTKERTDTTITVSKGPIYSIETDNDTLSTAKYRDEYSDIYSIYIDSRKETQSFAQTWKTRKKSSYLWESFSNTCLSDECVSQLLKEVSAEIFEIENPKVFITSYSDFENTLWMMEIAEHAFSRN